MSFNLEALLTDKLNKRVNNPVKVEIFEDLELDEFDLNQELDIVLNNENLRISTRRSGCYHPSSIGSCKRKTYYERVGEQEKQILSPQSILIFEIGHAVHEKVQARLIKIKGSLIEAPVCIPELNMYGNADYVNIIKKVIVDLKTINPDAYDKLTGPNIKHVKQVLCYMYACDFNNGQIMYINKSSGARKLYKFTFNQDLWDEVLKEIDEVETCVRAQTPPPKEVDYFSCTGCKFNWTCNPFDK